MNDSLTIRRATSTDAQELALLRWHGVAEQDDQVVPPHDAALLAELARLIAVDLADLDWLVWVAEVHTLVCGMVWVHRIRKVPTATGTPTIGYLTSAYVQASYRRHGIMTALVTQCQADARHHGLTVLLLSPMTASRRLYERCGFQVLRIWNGRHGERRWLLRCRPACIMGARSLKEVHHCPTIMALSHHSPCAVCRCWGLPRSVSGIRLPP